LNRRKFSARSLPVVASFLVLLLVPIRVFADEPSTSPSLAAPPSGVPVYDVTIINATPTGLRLNQSGDVVGWTTQGGPTRPMLFTPENGVIVLPTSTSQPYGIARDLSERAVGVITVVGEARLDSTGSAIHAVRWQVAVPKGTVIDVADLGVLAGHSESFGKGVNSAGQIVGNSDPNSYLSIRSFIYSDAAGMVDLGLGSIGQNAVARDLNDSGVVTGYLGLQAFRWSAAGGLQLLGAPSGWADSFGYAINASGQVAGNAGSASGNAEVVARYTDGTGWKVLGGTGEHNLGNGINQWGDVVGTGGGQVSNARGLIYTDNLGLLAFLDDLLLVPGSWMIKEAYDINDAQQITGWAINKQTGVSSAVLLTPVNPPPPNQPPVASFTYSCNTLLYCGFDGSGSTDDRGILSWAWTANGQTIGLLPAKFIGVQFSAPQTVDVTLTVTDARGATNAMTKPVVVGGPNQPPVASFTFSCDNSTRVCGFNGTGSTDDLGIVSYNWTFGDGATGTGASLSHTYPAAGSYPVTLTVADGGGLTSSLTATVTLASGTNQPPIPAFTITCQPAPAHVCTFDGSGSRDPDGTIVAYKWTDQKNRTLSTAVTFTQTFQRRGIKGKYTLAVTDNGGLTRRITKSFTVP
jgi:probable HAF family extracellular repeat protein